MPIVANSNYRPPIGFKNRHLQTIWPTVFRRIPLITTERERIDTPDGDFLDLDWSPAAREQLSLAILSHGLEGNSSQPYVQGMARALQRRGMGVLAWNFRGCSGEPNRFPHSYHSGATGDLQVVIDHALATGRCEKLALVGFSLGGNITLKYLGDAGSVIDPRISAGIAFSTPCDLGSSARLMTGSAQSFYMRRFMKCLRKTIRKKIENHPDEVEDLGLDAMRTFEEFDGAYTAPMNGFASADDYWHRCSSKPVLEAIRVPTLLVNALDDPFLPHQCHPIEEAQRSEHFHFENPPHGGHIGFMTRRGRSDEYWSETRAAEFLSEQD